MSDAVKAHEGSINFIRIFEAASHPRALVTGSMDKTMKFWEPPQAWDEAGKRQQDRREQVKAEVESSEKTTKVESSETTEKVEPSENAPEEEASPS